MARILGLQLGNRRGQIGRTAQRHADRRAGLRPGQRGGAVRRQQLTVKIVDRDQPNGNRRRRQRRTRSTPCSRQQNRERCSGSGGLPAEHGSGRFRHGAGRLGADSKDSAG